MKFIHTKFLALLVTVAVILSAMTSTTVAKSYRIALSLPLSGSNSKLAEQFLNGAKFAVNLHNQSHPIAVELIAVDDGCTKELATLAVEQLLATQPPISIATGFLCNEAAYMAADIFKEHALPILVAGAQSSRLIKDRERQEWNIWRMSPGDQELAQKAAQILSRRWVSEPYAIIDDGTVHGRTLADDFRAAMEELGVPPQFNDNFRPTQSTQARLVRRLKKAGVANVFVGADAEDITMITKNSLELAIPLEIIGSDVLSVLPFLPRDQRPVISQTTPLFGILEKPSVTNPFSDELMLKFLETGLEPDTYVYKGYAALQIAIEAIGETNQDTISNLSHKTFETVFGPISFGAKGENKLSPYFLYQWNGDNFQQVTN